MPKNIMSDKFLRLGILSIVSISILFTVISAQNTTSTSIIDTKICQIITVVRGIVGFLVLLLFIIGAIIYAIGHFLPASGNFKTNAQAYGIGMIIGGILGLILVIIAPYLVTMIINFTSTGSSSQILAPNC
jgi:hypothetical protein